MEDTDKLIIFLFTLLILLVLLLFVAEFMNRSRQSNYVTDCSQTKYGCCNDGQTVKADPMGSNCMEQIAVPSMSLVGGCGGTRWGCCPNGVDSKVDPEGTNCLQQLQPAMQNLTPPMQNLKPALQPFKPRMQITTPPMMQLNGKDTTDNLSKSHPMNL